MLRAVIDRRWRLSARHHSWDGCDLDRHERRGIAASYKTRFLNDVVSAVVSRVADVASRMAIELAAILGVAGNLACCLGRRIGRQNDHKVCAAERAAGGLTMYGPLVFADGRRSAGRAYGDDGAGEQGSKRSEGEERTIHRRYLRGHAAPEELGRAIPVCPLSCPAAATRVVGEARRHADMPIGVCRSASLGNRRRACGRDTRRGRS
jgi:hypothetical protein